MSITPFLGDQKFDPETMRIMGVAFEMARAAVKRDWGGLYANDSIAKRIIELAKDGERNPDTLRTGAQLLSAVNTSGHAGKVISRGGPMRASGRRCRRVCVPGS